MAVLLIALLFFLAAAPADTVRETEHPQLLGPGGPDDPEAAQSSSSSSGAGSGSGRSISSGG